MESVVDTIHEIHFEEVAQAILKQSVAQGNYSKIFVLADDNTKNHCLPRFEKFDIGKIDGVISIKPGEEYKTIGTCSQVWTELSEQGADRKSLLINIGGGVVTDLGGFVASTFKRGIEFINIPTTLLAMVDASVGGKTGVDLGVLKNQVGVIQQPKMVLIFPEFLQTLDQRQLTSGFAEMLKHGLILDDVYWNQLVQSGITPTDSKLIKKSIELKGEVVVEDPTELGIRKKLNFGHTLGHAIESYFLESPQKVTLLHGEAIAIGMILESYLSHKLTGLSRVELDEIKKVLLQYFPQVQFSMEEIDTVLELLKHDKKNTHGNINFVLLSCIGNALTDIKVNTDLLKESFVYYMD